MNWLVNLIARIGQGIWGLLTQGLRIAFGWLADGFLHFIAGGAVSGFNKVLENARAQAGQLGVRGTSTAIGYTASAPASQQSQQSRQPATSSPAARGFASQFL